MESILKEINAVSGVSGSFVCDEAGALVTSAMPGVFDAEMMSAVGRTAAQTLSGLQAARRRKIGEMDLLYAGGRIIIKTSARGYLVILCVRNVNVPLLNLTANLALKKLALAMSKSKEAAASTPPAAKPVGQPAPAGQPVPAAPAPSAAPSIATAPAPTVAQSVTIVPATPVTQSVTTAPAPAVEQPATLAPVPQIAQPVAAAPAPRATAPAMAAVASAPETFARPAASGPGPLIQREASGNGQAAPAALPDAGEVKADSLSAAIPALASLAGALITGIGDMGIGRSKLLAMLEPRYRALMGKYHFLSEQSFVFGKLNVSHFSATGVPPAEAVAALGELIAEIYRSGNELMGADRTQGLYRRAYQAVTRRSDGALQHPVVSLILPQVS